MTDILNKILKVIEHPQPVIKGGYGTAPSTPAKQKHTKGTWGTAISIPQPNQPASNNAPANRSAANSH